MALKENGREHEPQKRNKSESQLRQFLKLTKVSHMITETAAVERLAFKNWINPFCIGVVLSGKTVALCSCSVALRFSSVCFLNRCLNRRLHNFLPLSNQWSPWMWVKGRKDFFLLVDVFDEKSMKAYVILNTDFIHSIMNIIKWSRIINNNYLECMSNLFLCL